MKHIKVKRITFMIVALFACIAQNISPAITAGDAQLIERKQPILLARNNNRGQGSHNESNSKSSTRINSRSYHSKSSNSKQPKKHSSSKRSRPQSGRSKKNSQHNGRSRIGKNSRTNKPIIKNTQRNKKPKQTKNLKRTKVTTRRKDPKRVTNATRGKKSKNSKETRKNKGKKSEKSLKSNKRNRGNKATQNRKNTKKSKGTQNKKNLNKKSKNNKRLKNAGKGSKNSKRARNNNSSKHNKGHRNHRRHHGDKGHHRHGHHHYVHHSWSSSFSWSVGAIPGGWGWYNPGYGFWYPNHGYYYFGGLGYYYPTFGYWAYPFTGLTYVVYDTPVTDRVVILENPIRDVQLSFAFYYVNEDGNYIRADEPHELDSTEIAKIYMPTARKGSRRVLIVSRDEERLEENLADVSGLVVRELETVSGDRVAIKAIEEDGKIQQLINMNTQELERLNQIEERVTENSKILKDNNEKLEELAQKEGKEIRTEE